MQSDFEGLELPLRQVRGSELLRVTAVKSVASGREVRCLTPARQEPEYAVRVPIGAQLTLLNPPLEWGASTGIYDRASDADSPFTEGIVIGGNHVCLQKCPIGLELRVEP